MSMRLVRAAMIVAALLGAASWCPTVGAESPDLPVKSKGVRKTKAAPARIGNPGRTFGIWDCGGGQAIGFEEEWPDFRCLEIQGYFPFSFPPYRFNEITDWLNILGHYFIENHNNYFNSRWVHAYLVADPNPVLEHLSPPAEDGVGPRTDRQRPWTAPDEMWDQLNTPALCRSEPKTQPAPATEASQITCPYLKNQAKTREAPKIDIEDLDNSVLEKLDQLKAAERILRLADYYRKVGDKTAAGLLYLKVQKLCPGSGLDRKAGTRLRKMCREVTKECATAAEEEQEATPPQPERVQPQRKVSEADAAKKIGRLLEASHKAYMAGNYFRSAELARNALEIDAAAVQAHPLVYKMNLLKQIQDKVASLLPAFGPMESKDKPVPQTREPIVIQAEEEPPVEGLPSIEAPPREAGDIEESLRPLPPPIDPEVVKALEKVMAEAADPLAAKLVVLNEQPGTGEGQEDPCGAWFSGLPPVSFPSLLTEAEDAEAAGAEEESEDNPPRGPQPDLTVLLREVVEAMGGGAWVDIDFSRADGMRAQCELQIGGVDFKVLWGESGQRYAVLRLLPEACPDMRAVQRAQNDMIIDWIQSLSGNGDYSLPPGQEQPDSNDLTDELENLDFSLIES
jgi:hypothetical protein